MYTISKEFHFSASHILFGLNDGHPCGRMHGHNYIIVVELKSLILNDVGFVKDYRELDPIKKWIDDKLDHHHLNDVLDKNNDPLFKGNPSAETMARTLLVVFQNLIKDATITAITVKETPKTAATFSYND